MRRTILLLGLIVAGFFWLIFSTMAYFDGFGAWSPVIGAASSMIMAIAMYLIIVLAQAAVMQSSPYREQKARLDRNLRRMESYVADRQIELKDETTEQFMDRLGRLATPFQMEINDE